MRLYTYFRSSAAFRVRIVLALKGLEVDHRFVHMLRDGGEQHKPDYRRLSPLGIVPTLETDDGAALTQSLAICEYLEETHPTPALLPADPLARARVRALCGAVACEIHPLNNLRVLRYLTGTLGVTEEQKLAWYRHWIADGLTGVEAMLAETSGSFCHGDAPTLADAFLVPQIFNAQRFSCPLDSFPRIRAVFAHCMEHPAFQAARPEAQPDAEG